MKIEIEVTRKEKTTIEVTLPLYLHYEEYFDSGGSYGSFHRIYQNPNNKEMLVEHKITLNSDGEWGYEIDEGYASRFSHILADRNHDYYVKITEETFNQKVDEFIAKLKVARSKTV